MVEAARISILFTRRKRLLIEYRQATLLRIALANSIGFSASTAVPIWIGSVGAHFGFPAWAAGAVATGQLGCAALLNVATPWLFPRAHLRKLAFVATAIAVLGNGMAWLGPSSVFIVGCLLCGAGFGVLLNVTNRLVAGSSAPQRGYATVQLVEVLFCAGFFLGVPPILGRFGTLSVFAVLAALCTAVFFLLAGVPIGARDDAGGSQRIAPQLKQAAAPNAAAAALSLCAAAFLFAGQSTVNSSLVSIGAGAGLSMLWVGRVMALGLLASLGGAIFARGLGERAGLVRPLIVGAGVLGSAMLVVTLGGGVPAFVGGAVVLFMGIVFLGPYIYALLAGLDEAGRWASIAPAFVLTGWAFGPVIAGFTGRGVDFTTLGYAAVTCIAAAIAMFLGGQRLRTPAGRANAAAAANTMVQSIRP